MFDDHVHNRLNLVISERFFYQNIEIQEFLKSSWNCHISVAILSNSHFVLICKIKNSFK